MVLHRLILVLAALLAAPLATRPAHALAFDLTTVPGDSLTAGQAAAFQTAASVWSSFLTDNITVNIRIGFAALGANILGSTSPTLLAGSKAVLAAMLGQDATSSADTQAVASLASSTQSSLALTSAEAKAIGATLPPNVTSDGTIEFSTSFAFSETRDANGQIAAGTYDLIGIAEHEIGHLLGFVSSIDGGTGGYQTILDQFRYAGTGTRGVTSGQAAYFSIDSGFNNLANFATGVGNQASHWAIGTSGVMVPEVGAGTVQNITPLDVLAFDVLGYDVAVPEPASMAVLLVGVMAAAVTRRRNRYG